MIEPKELLIGKDKIIIQSLPATRALSIAARLAKVIGGAGMGISDFTLKKEEFAEAFHMGNMLQGVLQNIDADGAPELIRTIVRESVVYPAFEGEVEGVGGEERFIIWYETRFSRGLDELVELLYAIFAHNYGDPVEYIKKGLARAIERGWLGLSVPSSEEMTSESEQAS